MNANHGRKIFSDENQSSGIKFAVLFILALSVLQNTAKAESDPFDHSYYPMDFSLSLSHSVLDLEKNNIRYSINQRRISATFYDISNPSFMAGLIIGSSYLSIGNDPVSEGLSLDGYHIGFSINALTPGNPQLGLHGYYLFQETNGTNSLRTVTIDSQEWLMEALLHISVTPQWGFKLGGGMSGIDTERRVSGDFNETLTLKPDTGFQGTVGFEYHPYPSGRINLVFSRGIYTGTRLVFGRTF